MSEHTTTAPADSGQQAAPPPKPKRPKPKSMLMIGEQTNALFENARLAKERGEKVGWSASIFPQEIAETLGLNILYPENHSAGIAARHQADPFLQECEGPLGYSNDLCAYAKVNLAYASVLNGESSVELPDGGKMVAPDFLLVHESVCDRLLVELQRAVERQWGSDPRFAVDYPRMVDGAHARRVAELLSTAGGETVCGGEVLEEERYVAPTIVLNPDPQSRLMREEIFAPVLPVLTFAELLESADALLAADRPLALYYFGDEREGRRLCERVPSGGVAFNDVVMQVSSRRLPFGGVGASGMGRYHGEASFECFSNCRSYFLGSKRFDLPLRYAPYPKRLLGWLRRLMD